MKLMVIDGNSIVNRAFYGVRLLTTRDGTPTNAVFGFLNILQKLLEEESPDALSVTFDLKGPTFRHEQYEGYKAQRKAMPEELAVQMPILKRVLEAMNIPYHEKEGWEADDLIGTISRRCEKDGWDCVVVTGDKDSFQLITDKVRVKHVKTRMGQTETKEYDPAAFIEEYGFTPEKIVDLKALMGDSSDNIPGVAGVGEKTALDLVRRFGTVESIYGNLETLDIKDNLRKKLEDGREKAKMSFDLAEIRCDVPLEFDPSGDTRRPFDNDRLYEIFKELEFNKLIERMSLTPPGGKPAAAETVEGQCVSIEVNTPDALAEMRSALAGGITAAVGHNADLSLVTAECGGKAYIIRDTYPEYKGAMDFLFSGQVKKAGHYIKDTMRLLLEKGFSAQGWVFDTALAAYLLDPTGSGYAITRLTERYCGFSVWSGADGNGQMSLLDMDITELSQLLSEGAAIHALMEKFDLMLKDIGMDRLYYDIEMPLCPVLAEMERDGVLVDREALTQYGEMLSRGLDRLTGDIYALAGEEFNINSPKQLGALLFEKLMLPAPKKTKTGWSTNIEVLERLRGKHPIIEQIIDYRELSKLKSTYADGLGKVIAEDGRIHTTFQMTVTSTGRLSSTDPNLQNIPVRRELGEELRKMFIAEEGCVLVDADYSQIELRILAHISGDKTMQEAFLSGEDIHRVTASQVFDTPLNDVTPLQRSRAKAVNFGIVYGISQFSLAQDIDVPVAEAKMYMDGYLSKYHGVRDYMKNIVLQAKEDGYVTTVFGRRRWLPELKSSNYNIRSFGERVALNAPIQGTAADIMKLAMIRVDRRLKAEKLKARLILQIHDEIIAECPEEEAELVKEILCREMEGVADLSVPLTAEAHSGKSWYDAK